MPLGPTIRRALAQPFRTLRAIAAYQLQPPPMEEFADYDEYWNKRGAPSVIYRRWQLAAEAMEPGARVLDVGCGSSGFLAYLRQRRPDLLPAGCDTSSVAVDKARQAGFDAFVHDLAQAPLPGTYDYVTCFEVLEHIPQAETAFRNLKGAFRKKLFISVPNVGCLRCRVRLALFGKFPLTVCNLHVNEHVRHWTPRDFAYWMKREGMVVERMDGQYGLRGFYRWWPGLFAHGVVYVLRRADRSPS
jgi:SAM-dependent methyltransferase